MSESWIETKLLAELGKQIVDINELTRKRVIKLIDKGLAEGMSARELGDAIAKSAMFNAYRSEVIARTEANRVLNLSSLESFKQYGIREVEAVDGDQDPECAARHGQVYDVETAAGIHDHPNGTLGWMPIALGTRVGPRPPSTPPPVNPLPTVPKLTSRQKFQQAWNNPKPKPSDTMSQSVGNVEDIENVEQLVAYAKSQGVTFLPSRNPDTMALWSKEYMREIAQAIRDTAPYIPPAKRGQITMRISDTPRGDAAADCDQWRGNIRLFPLLAKDAKTPWGITKDMGDTRQVLKTTTHEIGHWAETGIKGAQERWASIRRKTARQSLESIDRQIATIEGALAIDENLSPTAGSSLTILRKERDRIVRLGYEPPISEYGRTGGWKEDFADSYYVYIHHRERMRERWPQRFAAMEEYFGGQGASA